MKLSNEILLSKVAYFEQKREKEGQQHRERIEGLAAQMSGYENENSFLNEEKEMFIKQIKSLEDKNRSQQNVIAYYQNNLSASSPVLIQESIPAVYNTNTQPTNYTFNKQSQFQAPLTQANNPTNPDAPSQPLFLKTQTMIRTGDHMDVLRGDPPASELRAQTLTLPRPSVEGRRESFERSKELMFNSMRGQGTLQTLKSGETYSMNRSNAEHLFSLSASQEFNNINSGYLPHEVSKVASTFTLNQLPSNRREGSAAEGSIDTSHFAGGHGQSAAIPLGGREILEVDEVPEVLLEEEEQEEFKGDSPLRLQQASQQRLSGNAVRSFDPYGRHRTSTSQSKAAESSSAMSRNESTVILHPRLENVVNGSIQKESHGIEESENGESERSKSGSHGSPKDEPMRREDFSVEGKRRSTQQDCGSNRSSQLFTDRALNLRQEINCLDDEILKLQNSLKNALTKRHINDQ